MPSIWAVYDCHNGHLVVWPLRICPTGEYIPVESVNMPSLHPLPMSVHSTRCAAVRALNIVLYQCVGTA